MQTQHKEWLTDRDLADRFGIDRSTVWRWVQDKNLPPPIQLSAAVTRWSRTAIDAFEAAKIKTAA
jgi:prophage regulatory protein